MRKYIAIFILIFMGIQYAHAQKMTVEGSDTNALMEVKDQETVGTITITSGVAPSTTTDKLYNVNGALYWNGSVLVTAGGGDGWTDGGENVYLSTSRDKVGIGDSSPTNKLDVAGTIGINDNQVLYLPDQTDFRGTLIVGTGGGSLSHSSGNQGRMNTGVGIGALNANTTGYRNTASGYQALYSNTTGYRNMAIGYQALYSNHEGHTNTASGYYALLSNTTGSYNTANGSYTLYSNNEGENNTAIGYQALYSNNTGGSNTAIGYQALHFNTKGNCNTASGLNALYSNNEGNYNMASGLSALHSNTEGNFNTASGTGALYSNITGNNNIASGYRAIYSNTTGHYNTGTGFYALYSNTTGIHNTGIGSYANHYNQAGSNNTMIGYEAGKGASEHDKSGNVFIGYQAGYNETGDNKLYIENSDNLSPLIGGDFSTNRVGINTSSPLATLDVSGTDAVKVTVGTTAERPASPSAGMIRFNSTSNKFEGYTGSAWVDLH